MAENTSNPRNPLLKGITDIKPLSEKGKEIALLQSLGRQTGNDIEQELKIERTKKIKDDSIRILNTEVHRLNNTIDSMNKASNISVNFSFNKNYISITIFALIAAFGIFRYFSNRKNMNKKN